MIIKIGTKLKRVSTTINNELTGGKTYKLIKVDKDGTLAVYDNNNKLWHFSTRHVATDASNSWQYLHSTVEWKL